LGTGSGDSVLEIVNQVEKETGKTINKQLAAKPRQGEYAKMIADTSRAKTVLGWRPKRTLKDSVESLIKWYSSRPQGWKR
jgi:UDP-glucose 4-epimerase